MDAYKICDVSGEDKSCSDGLAPEYSFSDHTTYFIPDSETICWFILNSLLKNYHLSPEIYLYYLRKNY